MKDASMTELMDTKPQDASTDTDSLAAAIQRVLAASPEPLTLPKIRAGLPSGLRQANLEDVLRRQVSANVLHRYPKYRSQHDRYWDRPMPVHIVALIQTALAEGPLGWSELRRKLPAYAQEKAETTVKEQLSQQRLHTHPRSGSRGSERIGLRPAEARDYLGDELATVFARLEGLGFSRDQIRQGALDLLRDEEWAPTPPQPKAPRSADKGSTDSPRAQVSQPDARQPAQPAPAPTTSAPAAASQLPAGVGASQP
jgi:hypothetical protein